MRLKETRVGEKVPNVLAIKARDVVAIPTRDGRWALARIFRGAMLGVFRCLSSVPVLPERLVEQQISFHVGFFCMPKQKADFDWVYLGRLPFKSDEDEWAPPQYSEDVASPGHFRLYYKGKITPANRDKIQGLEKQVMSAPASIRNRILQNCADWPIL
jgi:hypothetical protein